MLEVASRRAAVEGRAVAEGDESGVSTRGKAEVLVGADAHGELDVAGGFEVLRVDPPSPMAAYGPPR